MSVSWNNFNPTAHVFTENPIEPDPGNADVMTKVSFRKVERMELRTS